MNILTLAGLNLPQEPTSVKDIHICYLQYAIYNTFQPRTPGLSICRKKALEHAAGNMKDLASNSVGLLFPR